MIESAIQVDQISLSDLEKISSNNSQSQQNPISLPKTLPEKKKSEPKTKPKENKKREDSKKEVQIKEKPQPKKEINLEPKKINKDDINSKEIKESNNQEMEEDKQEIDQEKTEDALEETDLEEMDSEETNSNSSQLTTEQISEISYYANQISSQIRRNWKLPSYLINKVLTTQVEIKIDSIGRIIYKKIILSSGDDVYDSFVLKAIERASPYPRPFPSVQKIIENGIVLNVPSQ